MWAVVLPQEIVDSIIELCRDSTDDLKNCSLVSTSWTLVSRRHLFHTISLGVADRFRTQEGTLSGTQPFLQQFQQLDEFLEQAPYIAEKCIRCVKLRFNSYSEPPNTLDFGGGAGLLLDKVLARLARVEEFDLSLGDWASYPREIKHTIYAAIRQPFVSRLSILSSKFKSFPDLASLFIHSPGLKHLSVANLALHESATKLEDTSHLPVVYLDYLRIDTYLPYLVPAFSDTAFPIKVDRLRQLRLNLAVKGNVSELIEQLIKKTGASLLHLELSDTVYQGELDQIYL